MRRREFITLAGGAAAWPMVARGQQADRMRRIGVLMGFVSTDQEAQTFQQAFNLRLKELGWVEGSNARIDVRWAGGSLESFKANAAELVGLKPDVILANTTPAITVLQQQTTTTPIVFVQVTDPVGQAIVPNLAHPGGNVTGFSFVDFSVGGKWFEVLKEIAPAVSRVAVIYNPQTRSISSYLPFLQSAAKSLGVEMAPSPAHDDNVIERAVTSINERPGGGLCVIADPFTAEHRLRIIELAARHHVPAIYPRRIFAADGGLVAYGTDVVDLFKNAAGYIDRILKGEKAGDLPVQNPNKYELSINLKTAKALGLTVPPKLLFTADEVIE
jgi:putative ABC transport system substrate-binding protein